MKFTIIPNTPIISFDIKHFMQTQMKVIYGTEIMSNLLRFLEIFRNYLLQRLAQNVNCVLLPKAIDPKEITL